MSRCEWKTNKGRCKRKPIKGKKYCWQHNKNWSYKIEKWFIQRTEDKDFIQIFKGIFLVFFGAYVALFMIISPTSFIWWVYGLSSAIIILTILHSFKPKIFDFRFIRLVVLFVALGLVFTWGSLLIVMANESEDSASQNYGNYIFSLDNTPMNISLNNFLLYFDFNSNKGNVSFEISDYDMSRLVYLDLMIPKELNITNLSILSGNLPFKEGVNYEYENEYSRIHIDRFNFSVESREIKTIIDFNGHIIPNGEFHVETTVRNMFSPDRKTVEFVLGNYTCKNQCFFIDYEKVDSPMIQNNIFTIKYPENYYQGIETARILEQTFSLNTEDKNIIRTAETDKAVGTGLIVSSLTLLITNFVDSFLYMAKSKKKK